ncbi:MAG: D-TA family PLP-dependent enzyme [Lachnospiraceae bacterium]|jgi:D-serine deaminase-like pyridoxal phosphate-dependent protein
MTSWHFQDENNLFSPQLIVNRTLLIKNIEHAIHMANGAEHLWPHVKTHKSGQIIRLMAEYGISHFKCATISEAEMTASFGGKHIILAYPLVGPNISRFLQLSQAFPDVTFYAIGDNLHQLELLDLAAHSIGRQVNLLLDINMGMNRTGIPVSTLETFYEKASDFSSLNVCGLHCYDGHRIESDFSERIRAAEPLFHQIMDIRSHLNSNGYPCDILVMGGTPSFPCYLSFGVPDLYFSPGTLFLNDYGYSSKFPDLKFDIAAAVLTRVISHPAPGSFTLDLGYKGLAADPEGVRGILADFPHAHPLFQSEEHWVFSMDKGFEKDCPNIGDVLYIIPTHICPTSALYPHMAVIENGRLIAKWDINARNRILTY